MSLHAIPVLSGKLRRRERLLDRNPPDNIAVYGTLWRKFYYPNPVPNDFYSGNLTQEPWNIGLPENYYAFTWGDALFVILDVYRDCVSGSSHAQ
ncbi:MAG: hypothetical protein ACK5Q2_12795 [Bacteroidota bacterium]|jgi:hypothetical protein